MILLLQQFSPWSRNGGTNSNFAAALDEVSANQLKQCVFKVLIHVINDNIKDCLGIVLREVVSKASLHDKDHSYCFCGWGYNDKLDFIYHMESNN